MSWEDYYGIGWWAACRWLIPEWMRADLAIRGLLPDLKQALKEAAWISFGLQESSRDAASRSQRHGHHFMVENGYRRGRKWPGYQNNETSLEEEIYELR